MIQKYKMMKKNKKMNNYNQKINNFYKIFRKLKMSKINSQNSLYYEFSQRVFILL